ncbi:hypothetical protein ACQEVG_18650 [Streptomyces sp. CA-135486]|uniref:hypothetical protein n=1 Tax=Streptomyces sp. CA-135486 TaxID=3240049 RepID=UPI003D91553B
MESVSRLRKIKHPDEPLSPAFRAGIISTVAVLFRYAAVAEWDDVPARPLITHADMPRLSSGFRGSSRSINSNR